MSTDSNATPATAESAFAHFLALREAAASGEGPAPEFETWVRAYPHLEAELRQLESDWRGFDALVEGALGPREDTLFHRTPASEPDHESFAHFSPGQVIADFELVRRIGQGGMGEVWEARQRTLDRSVALKFIRPDRITVRAEAYFDREARAGGRLNHPGIVAVHATGRDDGLHWIAQELVEGSSTLKDFLKSVDFGARLPRDYFERVARFMAELCDALHAAHQADVIHRDVKPGNVMVTAEDRPKLTDFGLARLTDEAAFSGSYALKGTPIYMSPEQVLGKTKLIDHRTDVFSAGAVLFEMLTLHRPFEDGPDEAMARLVGDSAPNPRTLRADVPAELAAIALKALERRPSDRYPTAAAMADDLRRFTHHEPVRARPPGPLRRTLKWLRRHPTATAVLVLGSLFGATTYVLRDQAAAAAERRELAERDTLLTNALRAIDAGRVEDAERLTDEFKRLYPDDARGSLAMAIGYLRAMRLSELDRELAEYAQRQLPEPPDSGEGPAMDHFMRALHWQAMEDSTHPLVLDNLERAVALDPELEFAYFPVYLAYKLRSRPPEARTALSSFRGILRTSDPALGLVNGLLAELDGDFGAAVAEIEGARAEHGEAWFTRVLGHRELGRVLVRRYMEAPLDGFETLDAAGRSLERALEVDRDDYDSMAYLAWVSLRRHDRTPSPAQRRALLERALELSTDALAIEERSHTARQCRAVALFDLGSVEQEPERRATLRAALEEELAQLESRYAADPVAESLRSDLDFERASQALAAGDVARARELFEASAAAWDRQLPARVMLAQLQFGDAEAGPARALATLREAEAIDRELRAQAAPPADRWRFALYVWLTGAADHAGELDAAFEYAEVARSMAEEGLGIELAEAFTLAEFHALPAHPELADCGLVRWLFATYPIEATFADDHPELLAQVLGACD